MRYGFALLLAVAAAVPVRADGPGGDGGWPSLSVTAGGGALSAPHYPGSAGASIRPYPFIDAEIGDFISFSTLEGLRVTTLKMQGLEAGIAAGYRDGRSTKDLPPGLSALGGVDEAFTLGGFATWNEGPFSLDIQGLRDVVPGHSRLVLEIDATVAIPIGDRALRQGVEIGPYLQVANGGYQQTYFGIDAAHAAASGLPAFHPGGGPLMAGININGAMRLGGPWSLRGFANWGRLLHDAAASPIVRQGGDRDQVSGGLFLTYDF